MRPPCHFALLLGFLCCAAMAQSYPARPVRLIVPQAPGSSSDTVARIVAIELSPLLGQQVVVDNRPGGALVIGMDLTAKGTADGGAGSARRGAWMRPGSGP